MTFQNKRSSAHVRFVHQGNHSPRVISKVGQGLAAANLAGTLLKGAAAAQQVPDAPGKKLGWAIVGLGSLSINQILPAFAKCEKSKVVAFVSGHPEKANKLALRYGVSPKNIYNYQNYDTIKDNPEVDVIYVVLPNGMHAEYTVRGLQAGKHVLSEKPMANTPAECQQMIDAGRKANRKLMVAYRCRYEPYNQEAIRMARQQELGSIKVILADHGFQHRRSNPVAAQQNAGRRRIADGHRHLFPTGGAIYFWRRTH